eukprot:2077703-Rhodomonas_salina.5
MARMLLPGPCYQALDRVPRRGVRADARALSSYARATRCPARLYQEVFGRYMEQDALEEFPIEDGDRKVPRVGA